MKKRRILPMPSPKQTVRCLICGLQHEIESPTCVNVSTIIVCEECSNAVAFVKANMSELCQLTSGVNE